MNIFTEIKLALELKKLWAETKEAMMKNWRTTLMGIGAALLIGVKAYLVQHGVNPTDIIQMLVTVGLGYFAKDAHNTDEK